MFDDVFCKLEFATKYLDQDIDPDYRQEVMSQRELHRILCTNFDDQYILVMLMNLYTDPMAIP